MKTELEGQWTSSSKDVPVSEDAVAIGEGVTRREATVALGVRAKGV